METSPSSQSRAAWTWADLVSTYRFWGLLAWSALIAAAWVSRSMSGRLEFHEKFGLTYTQIGLIDVWAYALAPIGILLAWVAIRTKPIRMLLVTTGLILAATLVAPVGWPEGLVAMATAFCCLNVGSVVAMLVFPAIVAGGRGASVLVFVAVALAYAFGLGMGLACSTLTAFLLSGGGATYLPAGLLLVALVFLIPVKRVLFTLDPPARGRVIPPKSRDPVVAAILAWLVPFYYLYWLYQVHGEAAHLRASRQLLSPRGAVCIAFVPLMLPIILATLADHLNDRAAKIGLPRVLRVWVVVLCCFPLAPVAVGLLQAALNRLVKLNADSNAALAPALA